MCFATKLTAPAEDSDQKLFSGFAYNLTCQVAVVIPLILSPVVYMNLFCTYIIKSFLLQCSGLGLGLYPQSLH